MIGGFPKRVDSSQLRCCKCAQFRDDPDFYYCALDREDFPGLCEQYQYTQFIPHISLSKESINEPTDRSSD